MPKLFRKDTPRKLFTKRRIAIVGSVILGIALLWGVYAYLVSQINQHPNAAFVIDGKAYSKEEVASLTEYAVQRGTDEEDAAKQAFEYLKRQAAAKKSGLEPSKDDIEAMRSSIFPDEGETILRDEGGWVDLISYDEALKRKLSERNVTSAEGYAFIFQFDQSLHTAPDNPEAGQGDKESLAEDKQYARNQAEHYHKALQDGSISPDAALKKIQADARLGQLGVANSNLSAHFDGFIAGDATRPERYVPSDAAAEVQAQAPTKGLSDIKVGKSPKTEATPESEDDYRETYYYFIYIDRPDETAGNLKDSFEEVLNNLTFEYRGIE